MTKLADGAGRTEPAESFVSSFNVQHAGVEMQVDIDDDDD